MVDSRTQAYRNLIKSLLSCPSGEEPEILNTKLDLVDVFFLDAITEVSMRLNNQDHQDYITRLQNVINPLVINFLKPNLKSYIDFQMALPETFINSQNNPNIVHKFLLNNLNLLDEVLAIIMRNSVINVRKFDPQTRMYFAHLNSTFSGWMIDFTLGNRANNLEIAMAGYKVAITALDRQIFPHDWANALYNLGNAYRNRIIGDKSENLD